MNQHQSNQRPLDPAPQGKLPGGIAAVTTAQLQRLDGRSLTHDQLQALSRELLGVYAKGFMHSPEALAQRADEFRADLHDHLGGSQRLLILRHGSLCAVLCGLVEERPVGTIYHLGGLLLDPELQRKGLGHLLLSRELANTDADILSFHTQSRHMVKLAESVSALDPDLSREVAAQLHHLHRNLDPASCIDRGRYGKKPLYGDLTRLKSIGIAGLDLNRGDAQFFAGRVRPVSSEISL